MYISDERARGDHIQYMKKNKNKKKRNKKKKKNIHVCGL